MPIRPLGSGNQQSRSAPLLRTWSAYASRLRSDRLDSKSTRSMRKRPSSTSVLRRTTGFWLIAGFFALVYATGLLLPIGRHLPGFSFFRGPGRYGIVTTLAIALFAGQMLSQLASRIVAHRVTQPVDGVRLQFHLRRPLAGQSNGQIHRNGFAASNFVSRGQRSSPSTACRTDATAFTRPRCKRRQFAGSLVRAVVSGDCTRGVC